MNDLLWLPNSLLKNIKIPKITYEEDKGQDYGGYYTHGSNILVVVYNEEYNASTIAHEFCHHLQYIEGRANHVQVSWETGDNYEASIKKYFSTCWWEMEALLFEYKYAKTELNNWWLNKLVLE